MRAFGSLALLLATAGAACAATIPVRSGEHGDFTRLVLDTPARTGWETEADGDAIVLRLSDRAANFDLSRVYDRIDRSRVAEVSPGPEPGTLRVDLSCDCVAETFRDGPRMIVLDIAAQPDAPVPVAPVPAPVDNAPRATPPETPRLRLPVVPGWTVRTAPPITETSGSPPPSEIAASPEIDLGTRADPAVREAEERLLEQLGRAASQGLLSPRTPAAQVSPGEPGPRPGDRPAKPPPEPPPDPRDHVNLRAVTSVDAGSRAARDRIESALGTESCVPDAALDIHAWGDPNRSFAEQVGDARRGLSQELDKVDQTALAALVRTYLYHGFGAEAADLLTTLGAPDLDPALHTLARILEYGSDRPAGSFAGQGGCQGRATLWAVLSLDPYPPDAPVDPPSLRRSFSELPPHLRLYLGPILSRRLLAAGHEELADAVLRAARRASETPNERVEMAEAELLHDRGATGTAEATYRKLVDEDGETSPEAQVALVESHVENGRPVPEPLVALLAATEKEHGEGPLGDAIRRARILAEATSGNFGTAMDLLGEARRTDRLARPAATLDWTLSQLAESAEDAAFLRHAFALSPATVAATGPAAGNAMAARLVALGFPARAATYVEAAATGADGRARRLLRARIALASGQPSRAEADLLGLTGADADRLRAEALAMAGDPAAASRLFRRIGDPDRAAALAWEGGDWSEATDLAAGALSDAAAMEAAAADPVEPGDPDKVLARNRALLAASSDSRATLEGLLEATRIEAPATDRE